MRSENCIVQSTYSFVFILLSFWVKWRPTKFLFPRGFPFELFKLNSFSLSFMDIFCVIWRMKVTYTFYYLKLINKITCTSTVKFLGELLYTRNNTSSIKRKDQRNLRIGTWMIIMIVRLWSLSQFLCLLYC